MASSETVSVGTTVVDVPEGCHWTIHNIPFGCFVKIDGMSDDPHCASAIGEYVVDLTELSKNGFFDGTSWGDSLRESTLNSFMALGRDSWKAARARIQELVCDSSFTQHENYSSFLIPMGECQNTMPATIGDYTDFYSSIYHATNVGTMFRGKENALKENWVHLPVGYHGRASSVVVSGTPIVRPTGQVRNNPEENPTDEASGKLDFEVEMAFFCGPPSKMGKRIPVAEAHNHIFGLVLMNDWSARDVQKWEYVPLGPFNGKNFATTISPWIITLEAMEPFKVPQMEQNHKGVTPLPYLRSENLTSYDVPIQVGIEPQGSELVTVGSTNATSLYWTFAQQLAHHTSTGCPFNTGDLCGSGTISGETTDSYGSLLEINWKGTRSAKMKDGTERKFIHDHDNIVMTAECRKDDIFIGFGKCSGRILPACPYEETVAEN